MRRLLPWLASALVVLAALLILAYPAETALTKGPYLQSPGKTEMTIMWESDALGPGILRYSIDKTLDRQVEVGCREVVDYPEDFRKEDSPRHKAYLYQLKLTGLEPGITYWYQIEMGEVKSEPRQLSTVPENPDRFTFIVYGDSRTNHTAHREVTKCFRQHQPAFIIHTGDLVSRGRVYADWGAQFFAPLSDIIDQTPIWCAIGNHEGKGENFKRLFALPGNEYRYSFDYGNAHFTCLDYRGDPDQLQWCEQDLAASQAQWKFVFYHVPSYNMGGHASTWGRDTFVPLFRKYGADFSFSGHSHLYERFFPLKLHGDQTAWPVTYIVTAGGGAPLYDTREHPYIAAAKKTYHYMVVTIQGNKLSLRALTPQGEEIDNLTVTKQDGQYDKDYLALVKPEETLILRTKLAGAISPRLPAVPSPDQPVEITFRLALPELIRESVEIELKLAETSQPHYQMDPSVVKILLTPNKAAMVTAKIRAKGKVKTRGTQISPAMQFNCRIHTSFLDEEFIGDQLSLQGAQGN